MFFYANGVLLGSLPKLQALLGVHLKVDVSELFKAQIGSIDIEERNKKKR